MWLLIGALESLAAVSSCVGLIYYLFVECWLGAVL